MLAGRAVATLLLQLLASRAHGKVVSGEIQSSGCFQAITRFAFNPDSLTGNSLRYKVATRSGGRKGRTRQGRLLALVA